MAIGGKAAGLLTGLWSLVCELPCCCEFPKLPAAGSPLGTCGGSEGEFWEGLLAPTFGDWILFAGGGFEEPETTAPLVCIEGSSDVLAAGFAARPCEVDE